MTIQGRPKDALKRTYILDAAAELFLTLGFELTTMDDVAKTAGVSKQTVYSHFNNKETLFGAAIGRKCELYDLTEAFFAQDLPVHELMLELAKHLSELLLSEGAVSMYRLCSAAAKEHPKLTGLFFEAGPEALTRMLMDYLSRQTALGLLSIPNIEFAAVQFQHMVRGESEMRAALNLTPWAEQKNLSYLHDSTQMFLRAYGYQYPS